MFFNVVKLIKKYYLILLCLFPLMFLIKLLCDYTIDMPFWDQWALVPIIDKYNKGNLSFYDLWSQHNEHRLIFPRIIMLLLAQITRWNTLYEVALNVFIALGTYGVMIYYIRRTKILSNKDVGYLGVIISVLIFSSTQWENWIWGWQIQIFLNIFAIVLGFFLLASPVFTWWRFVAALITGVVATYSFGNGLLYWPIGLFQLFLITSLEKRTKRYILMSWLLFSVFIFFTYFYGYLKPNHHPSVLYFIKNPYIYLKYVFVYLGAPIASINKYLSFLMGFAGFAIFSVIGVFSLHNNNRYAIIPWLSLGLYGICSAFETGVARAGFGVGQALAPRYITISSLMWISILVLLKFYVQSRYSKISDYSDYQHKNCSLQKYIVCFYTVIFVLLLFSINHGVNQLKERYEYLLPARNELLSACDDRLLLRIYPSPSEIRESIGILEKNRISVFRDSKNFVPSEKKAFRINGDLEISRNKECSR